MFKIMHINEDLMWVLWPYKTQAILCVFAMALIYNW